MIATANSFLPKRARRPRFDRCRADDVRESTTKTSCSRRLFRKARTKSRHARRARPLAMKVERQPSHRLVESSLHQGRWSSTNAWAFVALKGDSKRRSAAVERDDPPSSKESVAATILSRQTRPAKRLLPATGWPRRFFSRVTAAYRPVCTDFDEKSLSAEALEKGRGMAVS